MSPQLLTRVSLAQVFKEPLEVPDSGHVLITGGAAGLHVQALHRAMESVSSQWHQLLALPARPDSNLVCFSGGVQRLN